jgi:hypothetical protein
VAEQRGKPDGEPCCRDGDNDTKHGLLIDTRGSRDEGQKRLMRRLSCLDQAVVGCVVAGERALVRPCKKSSTDVAAIQTSQMIIVKKMTDASAASPATIPNQPSQRGSVRELRTASEKARIIAARAAVPVACMM